MRLTTIILAALLAGGHALGQESVLRARAELITVDDGLPQGLVWSMLQDRTGFLWFATKDGLDRFDGHEHVVFRHDPADTNTIRESHVTSLFEDSNGLLWIGTDSKGVDRYDPATGRFTHLRKALGAPDIPTVVKFREHPNGEVWVNGFHARVHVAKLGKDGKNTSPMLQDLRMVHPEVDTEGLRDMEITRRGDVWVLGKQQVSVYRQKDGYFALARRWSVDWPYNDHEFLPRLVFNETTGRMALSWADRLVMFDTDALHPTDTLRIEKVQMRESTLYLDEHDRLWGLTGEGMWFRLDLHDRSTTYLDLTTPGGRSLDMAWSTTWMMDRTGIVWCGTTGYGVIKYDPRTERFHRWPRGWHGMRSTELIQADLAGITVLNAGEFRELNGMDSASRPIGLSQALERNGLDVGWQRVVRDPRGIYWFCGISRDTPRHLYSYDPKTGGIEQATDEPGDFYLDLYPGQGDHIWLSDGSPVTEQDSTLTCFDTRTGRVIARHVFPGPVRAGARRGISSWCVDPGGSLWIGCDHGVYTLAPGTGVWRHFQAVEGDTTKLPMSIVFSLCRDPLQPDAYIWVGTAGGGLACMEMATGQCRWYTERDGLPNNVIYGILPDGVGHLWISTNKGLCRFDPRTELMRTFTKADGLCGNEFNRYSAVASADGRLFFGGMEGVTWFDPADFPVEEPPSTTVLTELRLLNRPVNSIRSPELLPAPIHWVNELTIPHSQQMITFAFTCMDPTAPEDNQYRYQLEGLNTGWVHNGSLREATFTNLDPGHYTFRVQGRNHAGIWDPEGASISLTVTPPWYRTWAFRISILVALLGGAYMLYRSKLRQAMAVMHVRERIARDLHDSIGSTLSSVALYSTVVRSKVGDQMPQAKEMLDRITESTTEVMEAMNDIVWAVNTKNDDMAHVVQRMRAFGVSITEAAGIRLQLDVVPDVEALVLDMAQRRDLYLIFKEAVNNAVKYGQARTVRVGLSRTGGRVELVVEDDGMGFDPGQAASRNGTGGNGLPNMQRRAREMGGELTIRSAPGAGTCITLHFDPRHRKSLDRMTEAGEEGT